MALAATGLAILGSVAADGLSHALGFSKGGVVKEDGLHMLHKGEVIIPKAQADKMIKAFKKHKGLTAKDMAGMKMRHAKPHKGKRPT
jgi:hypothetical protein